MIWQSLLLGLHLLCVNLAAGGPLVCLLIAWRSGGAKDDPLALVGRRLAVASLLAFLLGAIVGLLQGWWWWTIAPQQLQGALTRLSSKVFFGVWELVFYVLCMAIYLVWWKWAPPHGTPGRVLHALVALAAATNLLWHFPPLMTILMHVAANEPVGDAISSSEFRGRMFSPEVFPLCVHVWLASLAVAGLTLALIAVQSRQPSTAATPELQVWVVRGGRIALFASLLQILVGGWVLFSSPALEQSRLLGGSASGMLLLITSIVVALWMLHVLSAIAQGECETKRLLLAAVLMTIVVFAMSAALVYARGNAPFAPGS